MHPHYRFDEHVITNDPEWFDVDAAHALISSTRWAKGMPIEVLRKALPHAINYGVYHAPGNGQRRMVGVARVVTDRATFAYLTDVVIEESSRGKGLSKALMTVMLAHPDLQGLRRFALLTLDTHGLYEKFGFRNLDNPRRYMERFDPHVYAPRHEQPGAGDSQPSP